VCHSGCDVGGRARGTVKRHCSLFGSTNRGMVSRRPQLRIEVTFSRKRGKGEGGVHVTTCFLALRGIWVLRTVW
jgi:hypothetical protein